MVNNYDEKCMEKLEKLHKRQWILSMLCIIVVCAFYIVAHFMHYSIGAPGGHYKFYNLYASILSVFIIPLLKILYNTKQKIRNIQRNRLDDFAQFNHMSSFYTNQLANIDKKIKTLENIRYMVAIICAVWVCTLCFILVPIYSLNADWIYLSWVELIIFKIIDIRKSKAEQEFKKVRLAGEEEIRKQSKIK